MRPKAIRREDVEVRWYLDGVFTGTRLEKKRHIFQGKDKTEYITSFGEVVRDTKTGKLYTEQHCVTGQSFSVKDWIDGLK